MGPYGRNMPFWYESAIKSLNPIKSGREAESTHSHIFPSAVVKR